MWRRYTATVNGNVAQVVAQAPGQGSLSARMLAVIVDLVAAKVIAQTGELSGIGVEGGGQRTVTDAAGRFNLPGVTPSENFQLVLTLANAQRIGFNIGAVPAGSTVQVSNIVVNASANSATPSAVQVEHDDDTSGGGDDVSNDGQGVSGQSADDNDDDPDSADPNPDDDDDPDSEDPPST